MSAKAQMPHFSASAEGKGSVPVNKGYQSDPGYVALDTLTTRHRRVCRSSSGWFEACFCKPIPRSLNCPSSTLLVPVENSPTDGFIVEVDCRQDESGR